MEINKDKVKYMLIGSSITLGVVFAERLIKTYLDNGIINLWDIVLIICMIMNTLWLSRRK